MIISHRHRFIFLKTNKTAGTSLEIALSEHCGEADIITPISAEDEVMRSELGFRGPQHYRRNRSALARMFTRTIGGKYHKQRDRLFFNHMAAAAVKKLVEPAVWNDYFKFCLERNPWDRFISFYFWRTKDQDPRPSISEFLDSGLPQLLKDRGIGLYSIDGEVAVDKVYLYEDLPGALADLTERFGFAEPLSMPRAKSRFRKDKRHPSEVLSAEEARRIGELFAEEIERYGYRF